MAANQKPRVMYLDIAYEVKVGKPAILYAVGHPRLKSGLILTSKVLRIEEGEIETMNTVYVRAPDDAEGLTDEAGRRILEGA